MTVSKMTFADVPAVVLLDRQLFSAECWSKEDFEQSVDDPNRLFLVTHDGEKTVACCGVQFGLEQADLLTVGVDPAYQRRGIANELILAMIEEFRRRGGGTFFLEVRSSNTAAQNLYKKRGFQQIAIRKNYYRMPMEDGLVFALEVHG